MLLERRSVSASATALSPRALAGLALAGGYGVLRKTPGGDIALSAKIYMGMVGGGGLVAIIGGLMFVYICVKNLYLLK